MSKTKTITGTGTGGESYSITYTGADNLNITGSTFNISSLFPTVTAKISGMVATYGTPLAWVETDLVFNTNSRRYYMPNTSEENISWANNATKTIPAQSRYSTTATLNTSTFFNSSNPTARTVTITYNLAHTRGDYSAIGGAGGGHWTYSGTTLTLGQTLTLNVPPSCSYTQLSKNTSDFYAGVTTVSTTISNLSAKYGGTISEVKLTVGSQSVTRTNNGTLSLKLNATGTFTPVVTVKDSRGQTQSYNLNAITAKTADPTTFNCTQVSSSTTGFYSNLSTASITISDCFVPYSGSVSQTKFTIGSQTAVGTGNGTLNITLNTAGTFTPTASVTDSFGRTYTKNLNAITINSYTPPSVILNVERVLSSIQPGYTYIGEQDDEGLNAVLIANMNWVSAVATLVSPNIEVYDPNGNALTTVITWYKTRAANGALSEIIGDNDWSTLVPADMPIYGLIDNSTHDIFDTNYSYQASLTPADNYNSGYAISQIIAQAFHTIDFLAGGHGISMGRPASREGYLDCDLKIATQDASSVFRAIFDIMHPVGSWYATSLRPKKASGETGKNMTDYFDPTEAWGGTWELLDEGIVLTSAGSNYPITSGTAKNGGTTTYTVSTTKLENKHIAHAHGFTQPKTPALTHSGNAGDMSKNKMGSFRSRKWGNNGNLILSTEGNMTVLSVIDSAYTTAMTTTDPGTVNAVFIDVSHTHTINHTHAAASCTAGAVHDLYGADSSRVAHGHGSVSTMQPYKNTYWWHRKA